MGEREKPDDVVGHKTYYDEEKGYFHKPLTRAEADAISKHCDAEKKAPDLRFLFFLPGIQVV